MRPAEPADAETAFQVQRAASLAAFAHVYPRDRYPYPDDDIRERWRSALADGETRVLLAERDGRAVGVVCYGAERLDGFYVVPEEWGRGAVPPPPYPEDVGYTLELG